MESKKPGAFDLLDSIFLRKGLLSSKILPLAFKNSYTEDI